MSGRTPEDVITKITEAYLGYQPFGSWKSKMEWAESREVPWDTNANTLGPPLSRTLDPKATPHLPAGAGGGAMASG